MLDGTANGWINVSAVVKTMVGQAPQEHSAGRSHSIWAKSDTVWCFSGKFVMSQADAKSCKVLIINVGMTCEDS
jgi:hypothetical protein